MGLLFDFVKKEGFSNLKLVRTPSSTTRLTPPTNYSMITILWLMMTWCVEDVGLKDGSWGWLVEELCSVEHLAIIITASGSHSS